jgi:outer membrane protein TolC
VSLVGLLVATQLAATPLTIEEVRAAARQQLDALRSELDLARAQENVRVARSSIFPQVNLSLGVAATLAGPQKTFTTIPQQDANGNVTFVQSAVETPGFTQGRYSLSLGVNQLLYDGGKWWQQIAQAGAQEEAARGQLAEQRLASELEAVRRFYALLNGQLSLKVFESSVKRSEEQVERSRSLFEAGKGTRSAVYDAMTNLANDQINVIRQKQTIVQARLALLQWLAQPDSDVEAVAPAGLDAPKALPSVAQALEAAKGKRPLLVALEKNNQAADLGVDVAFSYYLPRLSLNGAYFRSSPSADPFFTDPTRQNALQLGASLSWDLFNGFLYQAQLEQARVEARRSRSVQAQSMLDLEAELRRSHDTARAEVEVLGISEGSLKIAEEQLNLEEARFSAGAGSTIEVRNAQIKFTQAQLSALTSRANVAVARAALMRTIGGDIQ